MEKTSRLPKWYQKIREDIKSNMTEDDIYGADYILSAGLGNGEIEKPDWLVMDEGNNTIADRNKPGIVINL